MTGVGIVLMVLALLVGAISLAETVLAVAKPLSTTLTTPARQTPVNTYLSLTKGRYSVFELTGQTTGSDSVRFSEDNASAIQPEEVTVVGPNGDHLLVAGPGTTTENLTRNNAVYTAVAHFAAPIDGSYRVTVKPPKPTQVVIGPAFGSGLGKAWPWMLGGAVCLLGFIFGLVLVIVARARRVPAKWRSGGPTGSYAQANYSPGNYAPSNYPPGWYTDPAAAGRMRYWDGRDWNPDAK